MGEVSFSWVSRLDVVVFSPGSLSFSCLLMEQDRALYYMGFNCMYRVKPIMGGTKLRDNDEMVKHNVWIMEEVRSYKSNRGVAV